MTSTGVDRVDPPLATDEATMLRAFLDYHRDTLRRKTAGLSTEQLNATHPPSTMTLGGMLKHLALVEDHWFSVVLLGNDDAEPWHSVDWDADRDWEWHTAADDDPEWLRSLFDESVAAADRCIDAALADGGLDRLVGPREPPRAGGALQPPLDPAPHDRGVRPAQRPRRPDPRVHRRGDRGVITRTIRPATDDDWPRIWPFFEATVRAGETYAYPLDLTLETGRDLWMADPPGATVVLEDGGELLGSARMGPNRPGRGDHIGTASFMVAPEARGRGVGRALGEYVVQWHRDQGYRGIQFNAVVETNTAAVRLVALARLRDRRHGPGGVPLPDPRLRGPARDVPVPLSDLSLPAVDNPLTRQFLLPPRNRQ